jgi:hypothetical protein
MARKEDKLRPYRVDFFDISEMKENDLALVKSIIVRAVTAAEAIYHDNVAQEGRIIIRAYRFYTPLGERKKLVYKAIEDLFTANKAIKIMAAVEAYRAKPAAPVAAPVPPPPSPVVIPAPVPAPGEHVTRMSDSSLYDEVCVHCGATDTSGKLEDPCPATHTPTWSGGLQIPVSGPDSPATVAVVKDLNGMISHDAHEQTMDTFVPDGVPVGKRIPDPTNSAGIASFVDPEDLIEPGQAVGSAGRPRIPHWEGCACAVCETPANDPGAPNVEGGLLGNAPLWAKLTAFGVTLLIVLGIIRLLFH